MTFVRPVRPRSAAGQLSGVLLVILVLPLWASAAILKGVRKWSVGRAWGGSPVSCLGLDSLPLLLDVAVGRRPLATWRWR